jgi:hypothetical protein
MERQNTITRATRLLACSATFAAMVFAAQTTSAETTSCPVDLEGYISLCGVTFDDANGDKLQDEGEMNIGGPDATVLAVRTDDTSYANTFGETSCDADYPEKCGFYSMTLPPGEYDVCILKGDATCAGHPETQHVIIPDGGPAETQDVGRPGASIILSGPGTGTPGYWKNHAWPVPSLTVGGVLMDRKAIVSLMGKVSGDKTITIFASYVSARLNVIVGNNDSCVKDAIANAEVWLTDHPVGSKVAGSDYAWSGDQQGESYHQTMDRYNNGLLPCAVHRN